MRTDPRPILYHDPTSEPCRSVHWLAVEAGIELNIEYTWLTRGEHRAPGFLAINPAHQVPALRHGEFRLAEASAIMLYLADRNGVLDRWLGTSPEARACTHRFLSWHHTNTRARLTLDYLLPVLLMPAYHGSGAPVPGDAEARRRRACDSLAGLERLMLDLGGPFLGGAWPNLADVFIAPDLYALDIDPRRDACFEGLPALTNWLERLRETPGYEVSHAPWNAIAPRLRALLAERPITPRDCHWVAETCLAAVRAQGRTPVKMHNRD